MRKPWEARRGADESALRDFNELAKTEFGTMLIAAANLRHKPVDVALRRKSRALAQPSGPELAQLFDPRLSAAQADPRGRRAPEEGSRSSEASPLVACRSIEPPSGPAAPVSMSMSTVSPASGPVNAMLPLASAASPEGGSGGDSQKAEEAPLVANKKSCLDAWPIPRYPENYVCNEWVKERPDYWRNLPRAASERGANPPWQFNFWAMVFVVAAVGVLSSLVGG